MAGSTPHGRSRQHLAFGLLIAAVASAGLVAFVTRGTNTTPATGQRPEGEPGSKEDATAAVERPVDLEQPAPPRVLEKVEKEALEDLHVPSPEEAEQMRRPTVEPRRDIIDSGIAALMDEPKCEPPAHLVDIARSDVGVWGCVIETPDDSNYIVGRAAHRKRSGNIEVGSYEEGRRTGHWEQYYPTGILASEGSFVAGQRDGVWHEYDESGRHRISRTYGGGRKHGAAILYADESVAVELFFQGGQYDPATREAISRTELAEAR